MTDPEFETRLGRWFGEAPAFGDVDIFALKVEQRLDRSWRLRRVVIAAAGLVGGLFAVGQLIGAPLLERIPEVSGRSLLAAGESLKTVSQLRLLTLLPVGSEVLWIGAGLAFLAVVLLATRALEEF